MRRAQERGVSRDAIGQTPLPVPAFIELHK